MALTAFFLIGCTASAEERPDDVAQATVIDDQHVREGAPPSGSGTIERATGGSEVIVIELPADGTAAPSMGDLVRNARMQEAREKFGARQADCFDRVQFAGGVVQMRDQDVPMEKIRSVLEASWPTVEAQVGRPIPHWYKMEYDRIINVMERDKPTSYTDFASWFAKQCLEHGPWLNPAAQ